MYTIRGGDSLSNIMLSSVLMFVLLLASTAVRSWIDPSESNQHLGKDGAPKTHGVHAEAQGTTSLLQAESNTDPDPAADTDIEEDPVAETDIANDPDPDAAEAQQKLMKEKKPVTVAERKRDIKTFRRMKQVLKHGNAKNNNVNPRPNPKVHSSSKNAGTFLTDKTQHTMLAE